MNPVSRGIRNAFRNGIRTGSIVLILGLSIGLSLTMLVAQKAVDNKIKSVKSSIGNTITVAPAGFNPGSTANNALSTSSLAKVSSLMHVSSVTETLSDRESTTGTSSFGGGMGGPGGTSSSTTTTYTTSLASPVTISSSGPRFFQGGSSSTSSATFSLPITFLGTNTPTSLSGTNLTLQSGKAISGSVDTNDVLISAAMAKKNNLSVGSTFSAYNTTLMVAGIFNTSNRANEDTVILSLAAMQRLSGQSGVITSATVTVDSLDNLSSVTTAVKSTVGSSADVTSAQQQADNTVKPLNSVKTVTTFSLIGAVVAGAVIILLVMIMVVRERRREIGVIKAIGGSNLRIVGEFMVESLTLAILGAVVGLIIGVVGGQPVTKTLVTNSTSSTTSSSQTAGPGGMGAPGGGTGDQPTGGFGGGLRRNNTVRSFSNIKAQIGPSILLEGFGAAVLIAVIGSALSAAMISKVRPATVMRTE